MNRTLRPWLFALPWTIVSTQLPATPARAGAIVAYPANQAGVFSERDFISIGVSRESVTSLLGDPEVRVNDEFWIYWDFRVRPEPANPRGFDALIVRFSGDTVAEMKLCDRELIRRVLTRKIARRHE